MSEIAVETIHAMMRRAARNARKHAGRLDKFAAQGDHDPGVATFIGETADLRAEAAELRRAAAMLDPVGA